jgi:hypothetical protein
MSPAVSGRYNVGMSRGGWLLLLGLSGCRTPAVGFPPPEPVTVEPAVVQAPAEVEEAPDVVDQRCDEIRIASDAIADAALAELRAETELDLGTLPMEQQPGVCMRGPGGAWVFALADLEVAHAEWADEAWWWVLRGAVVLTFVRNDGTVVPSDEAVELTLLNSPELGETVETSLVAVHDYTGDGLGEVAYRVSSSGYDLDEQAFSIEGVADDEVVDIQELVSDAFHIDALSDYDGDGVLDIVDEHTYWHTDECFGMSGTPGYGFPPVLIHARADGALSSSDAVAQAFLEGHCPSKPDTLIGGGKEGWEHDALHRIACARLWGTPTSELVREIRTAWSGLTTEDLEGEWACGWPRSAFEEWAHIDPPVVLGQSK